MFRVGIGQGSSFWFDLEIPEATDWVKSAMSTTGYAYAASEKQIIGFEGSPYTILIVDDRWENRTVITSLLQPLGFNVVEASNGKEGLEKAIALKPDLIVTDLLIPEMDGFELIEHLRHTPEIQNVKIIVSSASVFEADKNRSLQAGGDTFLTKPIHLDELLHQLEQYLNLVWIYKQSQPDGEKAKEATTVNSQSVQLTPPSPQVLQELVTLASKGNFNAILKWSGSIGGNRHNLRAIC